MINKCNICKVFDIGFSSIKPVIIFLSNHIGYVEYVNTSMKFLYKDNKLNKKHPHLRVFLIFFLKLLPSSVIVIIIF